MDCQVCRQLLLVKVKVDLVGVAQECLDEIRRGNDDRDRIEPGGGANFHDEDDAYGHYIATEVRKFNDEIVKHAVKSEIQNVAHMGYFSSFGGIPARVQAFQVHLVNIFFNVLMNIGIRNESVS